MTFLKNRILPFYLNMSVVVFMVLLLFCAKYYCIMAIAFLLFLGDRIQKQASTTSISINFCLQHSTTFLVYSSKVFHFPKNNPVWSGLSKQQPIPCANVCSIYISFAVIGHQEHGNVEDFSCVDNSSSSCQGIMAIDNHEPWSSKQVERYM